MILIYMCIFYVLWIFIWELAKHGKNPLVRWLLVGKGLNFRHQLLATAAANVLFCCRF
jgi:hypothetical protein